MTVEDAYLFCKRYEGHYTDSVHKLLGGETTDMPMDELYSIIDVFAKHGRRLKMLTNGFNLLNMSTRYLNRFESIELNNHGINEDHVKLCERHLSHVYNGEVIMRTQKRHFNLEEAQKHCIIGEPCVSLLNPPVLFRGIMYPCCIHPGLELWNRDTKMSEALLSAGWGVMNPDVAQVVASGIIPEYVRKQCSTNCWVPRRIDTKLPKTLITLKPNDVIHG